MKEWFFPKQDILENYSLNWEGIGSSSLINGLAKRLLFIRKFQAFNITKAYKNQHHRSNFKEHGERNIGYMS